MDIIMEHHLRALVEPIRTNLIKLVEHEKILFEMNIASLKIKDVIEVEKAVIVDYFGQLNSKLGHDNQITELNFNGRPISIKTLKSVKKPNKTEIIAICKSMLSGSDYENLCNLIKAEESAPELKTVVSVAKTDDEKEIKRKIMESRKSK